MFYTYTTHSTKKNISKETQILINTIYILYPHQNTAPKILPNTTYTNNKLITKQYTHHPSQKSNKKYTKLTNTQPYTKYKSKTTPKDINNYKTTTYKTIKTRTTHYISQNKDHHNTTCYYTKHSQPLISKKQKKYKIPNKPKFKHVIQK